MASIGRLLTGPYGTGFREPRASLGPNSCLALRRLVTSLYGRQRP